MQSRITRALQEYDEAKPNSSLSSDENPTISYLKHLVCQSTFIDENNTREYLFNHHIWRSSVEKINATDKCIIKILVDIIMPENSEVLIGIRDAASLLKRVGLLTGVKAQANFNAATIHGGESAKDIFNTLLTLNSAGLLTGAEAQINFEMITGRNGQYIRKSVDQLRIRRLLIGSQARDNFEAITVNRGKYTQEIANALVELQNSALLTEVEAEDNRHALISCQEHAKDVAFVLWLMRERGLFTDKYQAQANFDAITFRGGKYAREIHDIREGLHSSQLLNATNAQDNFNKLKQYIQYSINHQHGIGFVATVIRHNAPITQELYDLLVLHDTNEKKEEDYNKLIEALNNLNDNKSKEEENSNLGANNISTQEDNTTDYGCYVREIIDFCEYIDTYFKEDGQNSKDIFNTISGPLIDSIQTEATDFHVNINTFNEIFLRLANITDVKPKEIINTLFDMMKKNQQSEANFSEDSCKKRREAIEAAIKQNALSKFPYDLSLSTNEHIITLLLHYIDKSPDSFKTIWGILFPVKENSQDSAVSFDFFHSNNSNSSPHSSGAAIETKDPR